MFEPETGDVSAPVDINAKQCVDFIVDLVALAVPYADEKLVKKSREVRGKPEEKDKELSPNTEPAKTSADLPHLVNGHFEPKQFAKEKQTVTKKSKDDQSSDKENEASSFSDDLTVAIPIDLFVQMIERRRGCVICDSPQVTYQAVKDGVINRICSDDCLHVYKRMIRSPPCLSCKQQIPAGCFAFKPTFGQITGVVCSEVCLERYDMDRGPKPVCKNASCGRRMIDKMYHWQTMDFCSPKCVNEILVRLGSKCAHCKVDVPFPSIGKYSVRFGEIVRQFCSINCLGGYKKSIRSCAFCQTEVNPKTISMLNQRPVERDFGEGVKIFCTSSCLDDYLKVETIKKIHRETATTFDLKSGDICDICACFVETNIPNTSPDHIYHKEGNIEEEPVLTNTAGDAPLTLRLKSVAQAFLCSPRCASAYRFKRGHNNLFCYYCFKLDWNMRQGVLLRFGQSKQRIFCSKRCMNLFIMRVRKLRSCEGCKCQKYQFDLIEETSDPTKSMECRYYCSLTCLNIMSESQQLRDEYGHNTLDWIKCTFCLKVQKGFIHVRRRPTPSDPTFEIVLSFCSYSCLVNFQKQEAIENAKRKEIEKLRPPQPITQKQLPPPAMSTDSRKPLVAQNRQLTMMNAPQNTSSKTSNTQQPQPGTSALKQQLSNNTNTTMSTNKLIPAVNVGPSLNGPVTRSSIGIVQQQQQQQQRPQSSVMAQQVAKAIPELVVVKEPPKRMTNASCQVRMIPRISKSIQCKPHLIDSGTQTDPL